jgi:Ca2+-binding RTX toxin-like protein
MTIQTTNIDAASGDAIDLTNGDEAFFTIANGVVVESQNAKGIVADSTENFFIYNYGSIVSDDVGLELDSSNDRFYNERSGSVFGFRGVSLTTTGETFVNYGDVSGDTYGVNDSGGSNVISNYGTIEGPSGGLNAVGGADYITNEGSISADGSGGAGVSSGTSASAVTTIDNRGTVAGDGDSIFVNGDGALILRNIGTLDGNVDLANSAGDTFTNTGVIYGNVELGNRANTLDNRHGGTVTGTITGGAGADTIHLGNDGETVNGGLGHDVIYGGAGADTFLFTSDGAANADGIRNFNVANDMIELSHATFTKLAAGQTAVFSIGTGATSASDHLYYSSRGGGLWYDPDGSGSQAAIVIANLGPGLHLTASNFGVV